MTKSDLLYIGQQAVKQHPVIAKALLSQGIRHTELTLRKCYNDFFESNGYKLPIGKPTTFENELIKVFIHYAFTEFHTQRLSALLFKVTGKCPSLITVIKSETATRYRIDQNFRELYDKTTSKI